MITLRERIADWIAGGPRIYKFGVGEVITGFGSYGGKPCIGFCRPDTIGNVGDAAPEYIGRMRSKSFVIVFEGENSPNEFIRLMAKASAYAQAQGVSGS